MAQIGKTVFGLCRPSDSVAPKGIDPKMCRFFVCLCHNKEAVFFLNLLCLDLSCSGTDCPATYKTLSFFARNTLNSRYGLCGCHKATFGEEKEKRKKERTKKDEARNTVRVHELCESRGSRPGSPSLIVAPKGFDPKMCRFFVSLCHNKQAFF